MNRNKLTKRFLLLSAALTMALGQSAFAGETVALNLDDAMLRAFQTNPTVSIAQYELDSARASYNAARQSRGISISVLTILLNAAVMMMLSKLLPAFGPRVSATIMPTA